MALSILAWIFLVAAQPSPASPPADTFTFVNPACPEPVTTAGREDARANRVDYRGLRAGEGLGILVGWEEGWGFSRIPPQAVEGLFEEHPGMEKALASLLEEGRWILPRVQQVKIPEYLDWETMKNALLRLPGVRYVERDETVSADLAVQEPFYPLQWYLERIGAEGAWEVEREGRGVIVAVVDTGVDYSHPELDGRVLPGHDFVEGDDDPGDENGHGTSVAGIIAASGDNGLGIAGMAWKAAILPVRVLDAWGQGSYSDLIAGIRYAADRGARVINISLGGAVYSMALQEAVDYARSRGAVLIASAGNEGLDGLSYPAACRGVVSVGAVDRDDRPATFSNRGEDLDLTAPGISVYTLARGGGYTYFSGTSAAAPQVTGAMALLLSRSPQLDPDEAAERLLSAAEDLGKPGHDPSTGWGILRADALLGYSPGDERGTGEEDGGESPSGWYFAEGYTGAGFHTYILLANAGNEAAEVVMNLFGPEGPLLRKEVSIPSLSRVTFHLNNMVRPGEVSASIEVKAGYEVRAQRSMYFQYRGVRGGHTASAALPSEQWHFAEGYTGNGFDTYLLVFNPDEKEAAVEVHLMYAEGEKVVHLSVPTRSRRTLRVNDVLPGKEFSTFLTSDLPVVVERAMYFDYGGIKGGSAAAGATSPGREWYFAEGYTGDGFEEWLLLSNPSPGEVTATLHFQRGDGLTLTREHVLPPRSRTTVLVDRLPGLESAEVSISVEATGPGLVAERAMYFTYCGSMGRVSGGHAAMGARQAASRWILPEGYTGMGFESWVLVANLEERPVGVRLRLLGENGRTVERWMELGPHSRVSILENDLLPGCGVSAEVEGKNGSRLVVEGASYYLFNEIGGGGC